MPARAGPTDVDALLDAAVDEAHGTADAGEV